MIEGVDATCIEEKGFWGKPWGEEWSSGLSDCYDSVASLFPHGLAWSRDLCSWMGHLINAIALAFCLDEDIIKQALEHEIFPWESTWFIDEFEKFYKLPDPCYKPTKLKDRQFAIKAKIAGGTYPSFENLKKMALALGCEEIEFINLGLGSYEGDDEGDELYGPSWAGTWLIKYKAGPWNLMLECKLKNFKPQNIDIIFQQI